MSLRAFKIEPAIYPREPEKIVAQALSRLGLRADYFGPLPSRDEFPASFWAAVCQELHLSCDCYSYGYLYQEHKYLLRTAWEEGKLALPWTAELRCILNDSRLDAKRDRDWRKDHYGLRLRARIRSREILDSFARLPGKSRALVRMYRLAYQYRTKTISYIKTTDQVYQ